jgi:hypothetical protein
MWSIVYDGFTAILGTLFPWSVARLELAECFPVPQEQYLLAFETRGYSGNVGALSADHGRAFSSRETEFLEESF